MELGKSSNITAAFHLKEQAAPRFCNARPVPYALGRKIEDELNRLQQEGIIEPVPFSEWASDSACDEARWYSENLRRLQTDCQ